MDSYGGDQQGQLRDDQRGIFWNMYIRGNCVECGNEQVAGWPEVQVCDECIMKRIKAGGKPIEYQHWARNLLEDSYKSALSLEDLEDAYEQRVRRGIDPDDLFNTRSTVMDEEELREYLQKHLGHNQGNGAVANNQGDARGSGENEGHH